MDSIINLVRNVECLKSLSIQFNGNQIYNDDNLKALS